MAESNPISSAQIAEPNLLNPVKKEFKELNDLLDITNEKLVKFGSEQVKIAKNTPPNSAENIENLEKALSNASTAYKELDKVEKDRLKLQEKLNQLSDERIKTNFDLREQIRRQTKELRDNSKATADSSNEYEILKRRTNEAQAEFKRLLATASATDEEIEEARKSFESLDDQLRKVNDSAKDGRRDVGRYKTALGETKGKITFLTKALYKMGLSLLTNPITLTLVAIAGALALVTKAFKQSASGSELLRKGGGNFKRFIFRIS